MNLTGTAQVYSIASPGAWPRLLTDYPERVSGIYASPRDAGVILTRDLGGNEHHQVFWMDLDSAEVSPITEDLTAVHQFGAFSPDGKTIVYTSTARNGKDYDLYLTPLHGSTHPQRILDLTGSWRVLQWTKNGEELLMAEILSNAAQSLYRYRFADKSLHRLTPTDEPAQYLHAHLTTAGDLYCLTDYGRDFLGLARVHGEKVQYLRQEDRDYDLMVIDEAENHMAYTVNREGFSELYLAHHDGSEAEQVGTFHQSLIHELVFDATGEMLAVTHSGPDHNMNISAVQVTSHTVTQWTHAPMAGLQPESFSMPDIVSYRSFDGLEIPAYLYRPTGRRGQAPVILSVHGGPEAQERPYFNAWYQYLVHHGYAILAPNVRGSTGYGKAYSHLDDREKRMDSVRDLQHAVEWIRSREELNGHKIAIMGGSYGGYMVLSGITQYPDLFQAAIDIVGIANLESFLENTSEWRRALREVEYGYLATDRQFLREFSPIHYVNRIKTPLFVVHGQNDPRVPVGEALQIVEALRGREQPVEYRVFADEGHGIVKLKNRLELYPQLVEFLDRYLKS